MSNCLIASVDGLEVAKIFGVTLIINKILKKLLKNQQNNNNEYTNISKIHVFL